VYGKTDDELFPQETAREFMANDRKVRESGTPLQTIEKLQHDDGWHYSLVNKFPIPTGDKAMMLGGIAIDITQHRGAEATLRESEERLRVFAAHLGHLVEERTRELVQSQADLRALATELNLTEERERKRLATDLHDYLAQILVLSRLKLAETRRGSGLPAKNQQLLAEAEDALSEALTYIRTLIAELSPPVLHEFGLAMALKWLGEWMDRYQLAVTVELIHEAPPLPEHHAMLLFQSVRELLLNTAKHAGSREATVRLEITDHILRLHVRDNGKGFDPALATASAVLASKFGLFSIRERMKALGGDFKVTSSPGKGTSATLILPVHEMGRNDSIGQHPTLPTKPAMPGFDVRLSPSEQGLAKTNPIRVLLVDDHAMVRQGLRSVLDSYDDVEIVGEAQDGIEATALAETLKPSVIVMDINMPRMNGIEATVRIKKLYPEIVVIGLSVNNERENQDAMKKAGAADLLPKEAAVDELHNAILVALRKCEEAL
jgi:signal transduction histidine kinase/CheY-like chemotaxis protein